MRCANGSGGLVLDHSLGNQPHSSNQNTKRDQLLSGQTVSRTVLVLWQQIVILCNVSPLQNLPWGISAMWGHSEPQANLQESSGIVCECLHFKNAVLFILLESLSPLHYPFTLSVWMCFLIFVWRSCLCSKWLREKILDFNALCCHESHARGFTYDVSYQELLWLSRDGRGTGPNIEQLVRVPETSWKSNGLLG